MRNAIAGVSTALAVALAGITIVWIVVAAPSAAVSRPAGSVARHECVSAIPTGWPGEDGVAGGARSRPTHAGGIVARSGWVRLPDGTSLRYVEQGPASGPAIVLLHGYSDSWFSFSRVLPLMPATYRIIAPDQRGHGCSDQPASGYAIRDLAGDVISLMNSLGIERPTVVGHSMGSLVAQQVAALDPRRIDRLVLVGSATRLAHIPGMAELGQAIDALTDPVDPVFIREFQLSTVHRPLPTAFLDGIMAESGRLPARVWKALMHGMLDMESAELERVRMPVLIVWGENDAIFPRSEQDALRRRLPGATLRTYAETGHAPHWERPDDFVADLLEFMQRTPTGKAAS